MKTIKVPKGAETYHITCSNDDCAAVVECNTGDLRYEGDPKDGPSWVMKCPHCKKETWIAVSMMVNHIAKPSP